MEGILTYRQLSKHMGASKHTKSIQTYRGHPNIWGHTNLWGYMDSPLVLTKHAFFVLYMYSRHQSIIQTYRGASKHVGVSKHIRASKHMQGIWHPNIWGCPNIQGHSCMPSYPVQQVLLLVFHIMTNNQLLFL